MVTLGFFEYRVRVEREEGAATLAWVGRSTGHGLVGADPNLELSRGRLTLRATETADQKRDHPGWEFTLVRKPRFPTLEAWREHLSAFSKLMGYIGKPARPLKLEFDFGDAQLQLAMEEEATAGPFVLRAAFASWDPTRWPSRAAIVRQPEDADRGALRLSLNAMIPTDMEMVRYD